MKLATCTLAARCPGYVQGAIAQLAALKELSPNIDNYIIVEQGHYDRQTYSNLEKIGYIVLDKPPLRPTRKVNYVASRWRHTFNKFYIWTLTDYDRVVFLDADCLPIVPDFEQQMIDLQDKELSASRVNVKANTRFNSGVMCIKPSMDTYSSLLETLHTHAAGAELSDQGLLNIFFKEYRQLPDVYNMRGWNNRVLPNIVIAHLRPTPWTRTTGCRGWMHYRNTWQQRYNQGIQCINS
jgi:alpha-N-acetylglucosamine transferase